MKKFPIFRKMEFYGMIIRNITYHASFSYVVEGDLWCHLNGGACHILEFPWRRWPLPWGRVLTSSNPQSSAKLKTMLFFVKTPT